jgi:hypothetical protein
MPQTNCPQPELSVVDVQLTSLKSFVAGLHSLADSAGLPNLRSAFALVDAIVADVEDACRKIDIDASQVTSGEIDKDTFESVVVLPLKDAAEALEGALKKAAESLQEAAGQYARTLKDKALAGANANAADADLMAKATAAKTLYDLAPSFEVMCAGCLEALFVVRINNVAAELRKKSS